MSSHYCLTCQDCNISQNSIGPNTVIHINTLDNKIYLITNDIKKLNYTCEAILSHSLKLGTILTLPYQVEHARQFFT